MPESSKKQLKVFFHAIDGIGHLNACVGLAQALAKRGHRIYFLLNDAFAGQFAKFGFDEILLTQAPKPQPNGEPQPKAEANREAPAKKNPVKDMAELLIKTGFLGPKTPLEKIKDQEKQPQAFMETIYHQMVEYNPQIEAAIQREKPDLFIIDSFLLPPAIRQAGIPWLLLFSANPNVLFGSDELPPFGSGYPSKSDKSTWEEFKSISKSNWNKNFSRYQDELNQKFNFEPPADDIRVSNVFTLSKYLNIYGYPTELDYDDLAPRPKHLAAVDAFCRDTPEPFEIPEELANKPGKKLIYVSLGSMGSIDVELMKRILAVLAKTPHKYIVSKGQRGDEYDLPENCWGENVLPQTKILPLVDLVITHGGNNTITETFSFGKPMIVMPLFGDQYDNAQRVDEKGYGVRIEPYDFTEAQLSGTIEKLLVDEKMQAKLKAAASRMAQSNSKERICEQIEQIVEKFQPEVKV